MASEIWKPIIGREGYEVSSEGRIRRVLGPQGRRIDRLLNPLGRTERRGRAIVSFSSRWHYVDALVCAAFHGPAKGRFPKHKNGSLCDNRAANLEWSNVGLRMKWTDEVVARMYALRKAGLTGAEVGKLLGVTETAVLTKLHRLRRERDARKKAAR